MLRMENNKKSAYKSTFLIEKPLKIFGEAEGFRTLDPQNHNLML
jgi:hypothetical protein